MSHSSDNAHREPFQALREAMADALYQVLVEELYTSSAEGLYLDHLFKAAKAQSSFWSKRRLECAVEDLLAMGRVYLGAEYGQVIVCDGRER